MQDRSLRPARGRIRGLVAAAWLGLCACNHQLPRLSARGQHAEVVERAAHARYRPRGEPARAWARSLTELGRSDEARAVLLRDFRVTADLRSLVALADLELREGLRGLAAVHFARAASLEVDTLRGRTDVCALFRERAGRFLAEGEAVAADLDMRRIAIICPVKSGSEDSALQVADRALHLRITAAAKVQVRAQRTLPGCRDGACKAVAAAEATHHIDAALAQARSQGPAALRIAARRLGVQLTSRDVAELLAAELRGELGLDIVTHDELRAWIGETAPVAIHTATGVLPEIEKTYARLRLGQLGSDYAAPGGDGARSTASLVVKLLELFDADPGAAAMSWRVFVLIGDLPSAELALTTGLGVGASNTTATEPTKSPTEGVTTKARREAGRRDSSTSPTVAAPPVVAPSWSPTQTRVPVPSLWSARRQVDVRSLPKLLLLARLRGLGGHDAQALEITSFALAEAQAQGLADVEALAVAEGRRYLAAGQPWGALAIASVVPGLATESLARAAGSALVLARAACDGGCMGSDPRDRVAVRQVFGEPWLLAQGAHAQELALARPVAPTPATRCPELGELLAPGARGPLAAALLQTRRELAHHGSSETQPRSNESRSSDTRGAGEALRRAVEADPTLACAGRYAGPLMYGGDHRVAAEALADELSHAPQEVAAGALRLQSELALGLGRRDQAEQMLTAAAAASSDPRPLWLHAARLGAFVDARHYELFALRQGLLHIPASEAAPLRLALVVRSLRDVNDGWAVRESEVGREALVRGVESYLESEPPQRRWQAREDLANALARYGWADLKASLLLRAALWPEPGLQRQHPAAAARLEHALGGVPDASSGSPLAPAEFAAALAGPRGPAPELSSTALAFVPIDQLQAVRLEIARHHPDPHQRRAAAIALATTGEPAVRVQALHLLLSDLGRSAHAVATPPAPTSPPVAAPAHEDARRDAVADLLLAGLAAQGEAAEPMVPGADDLLMLVFGLQRQPARARPEIKGE